MRLFNKIALAGLLSFGFAAMAVAQDAYILRTTPAAMPSLVSQFGLHGVKDISNGRGVYLVHVPKVPGLVDALKSHPMAQSVSANSVAKLPELDSAAVPAVPKKKNQLQGQPSYSLWRHQAAVGDVNLNIAGANYPSYGTGVTVAVIDTVIDTGNPLLAPLDMTNAADFVANVFGPKVGSTLAQETSPFIDQETSPFIDGTGTTLIAQETSPFIDQETSPFIDQETSPFIDQETSPFIDAAAVGHGTMVAGLVRLVAPGATIMPIAAFDKTTGQSTIATLCNAIYWAASHGAKVINLSASTPTDDPALAGAIRDVQAQGVVVVAAVSNSGSRNLVFPAAYPGVFGVGALDDSARKTSFSDWGSDVDLSAPGLYVTSTFVHGFNSDGTIRYHWAMSSGTSFATPLTAGTAAAMMSYGYDAATIQTRLNKSATKITGAHNQDMGAGQLNVGGAVGK